MWLGLITAAVRLLPLVWVPSTAEAAEREAPAA